MRTASDAELAEMVDSILKKDDINKDGYISYFEYIQSQKTAS